MKKLFNLLCIFALLLSIFGCSATPPVQYYEESELLPKPDSIIAVNQTSYRKHTSNGKTTEISYTYVAEEAGTLSKTLYEKYFDFVEEAGLTVKEVNDTKYQILDNDLLLATLNFNSNGVEFDIKAQPEKLVDLVATELNIEDVIDLDFVRIKLVKFNSGKKLSEKKGYVTYSKSPVTGSNRLVWIRTSFKNKMTEGIELWGSKAKVIFEFDDTYRYEGDMINLYGGSSKTLQPMETNKIYIIAEVPKEVLSSYSKLKVVFAFNDEFDEFDSEDKLADMDYIYSVTLTK
jgi:hypothetical protein